MHALRTGSPVPRSPGASARCPGWGYQLAPGAGAGRDARGRPGGDRVRPGRVPARRPGRARPRRCADHGLRAVGGFVPVVLHDPGARPAARGRRRRSTASSRPAPACSSSPPRPAGRLRRAARRSTTRAGRPLLANLDRLAARGRRPRRHRHPAPARRHDGRERARTSTACWTARAIAAVPRHRPPADRRHRPGRAGPRAPRTGSCTRTSRTSTRPGPRKVQRRRGDLHRGRARRHVPAARRGRRRHRRDRARAGGRRVRRAGTCWSRTPSWHRRARTGDGPVADVRASIDATCDGSAG